MTEEETINIIRSHTGLELAPASDGRYTSRCPFAGTAHDAGTDRDVWWHFSEDGMPHAKCLHAKCQPLWDPYIADLYRALRAARKGAAPEPRKQSRPAAPRKKPAPRKLLDMAAVESRLRRWPLHITVTEEVLPTISPVRIPPNNAMHAELLLDALYQHGERILVFDRFTSQGDYLHQVGRGNFRLGKEPGVTAVKCAELPRSGPAGVWYLLSPVTGKWEPNPNKRDPQSGALMPGRRHAACCTRYPYLLLESDELPPDQWLRILMMAPIPIVACYTSGGKSIHAVIRVDAETPEQFKAYVDAYRQIYEPLGADGAAMSAVRLSRLPGCWRRGTMGKDGKIAWYDEPREQRLLYLDPTADPLHPMPLIERLKSHLYYHGRR